MNNFIMTISLTFVLVKFFLEVLDSHKGERLEWYIIILISVELGIGVYELLMKLT